MQWLESPNDKQKLEDFFEAEARLRHWRFWRSVTTLACIPFGAVSWAGLSFPTILDEQRRTLVVDFGWLPFAALATIFLVERRWSRRLFAAAAHPSRTGD